MIEQTKSYSLNNVLVINDLKRPADKINFIK